MINGFNKIPVLIAAFDEERNIGRTLRHLDPEFTEPIVISNGSIDGTADVARGFKHVKVIELEEKGKIPALQEGIRELDGKAIRPFVTLDADTYPLFPVSYLASMLRARGRLPPSQPAIVVGPSVYAYGRNPLSGLTRSIRRFQEHKEDPYNPDALGFCGRNVMLDLHDQATLEDMLHLPSFWPGADMAMRDIIVKRHEGSYYKTPDTHAICLTSGRRLPSLWLRMTRGADAAFAAIQKSYMADQPQGAIRYESFEESLLPLLEERARNAEVSPS